MRKCVPEVTCFPHTQCKFLLELSSFIHSLIRFAILQALLLKMLTPMGDGMSHCVVLGAAHAVSMDVVI